MRRVLTGLLVLAMVSSLGASQTAAPVPRGEPSPDGRTYLLVNPLAERHRASCVLVRRRPRAGAWTAPAVRQGSGGAPSLQPDPGDEVLSKVEREVPADQRCLDREQGYVLFDQHVTPGFGVVLERRDARGTTVWAKRLDDLFSVAEVQAFVDLGGIRVWTWGWWLDPARDEVVVLGRGAGMRRVGLSDGRLRNPAPGPAEEALLREHVGTGRESERRSALAAAEERRLSGLQPVLELQLDARDVTELWRLEVAAALLRLADHASAWERLVTALAPTKPDDVRRIAATFLHKALATATADRRTQTREAVRGISSAEARWLLESSGP